MTDEALTERRKHQRSNELATSGLVAGSFLVAKDLLATPLTDWVQIVSLVGFAIGLPLVATSLFADHRALEAGIADTLILDAVGFIGALAIGTGFVFAFGFATPVAGVALFVSVVVGIGAYVLWALSHGQ